MSVVTCGRSRRIHLKTFALPKGEDKEARAAGVPIVDWREVSSNLETPERRQTRIAQADRRFNNRLLNWDG